MAAPPDAGLVAPLRRAIEPLIHAPEAVQSARIGGISVRNEEESVLTPIHRSKVRVLVCVSLNQASANLNTLSQTPQGISKISTCLAMPRSERFSGVAAMPFDCNSFEASLSVTTRLVAKMERDVASPWTRAAIFTVRPK